MKDLSSELTVYVITIGGITAADCVSRLKNQDCKFQLDTVENYSPSAAAFQEMINRCETPYYIQVDEDMLLRPDAVRRMYNGVIESGPKEAIIVYPLWDVHLDRWIFGVKIYKHEIMKNYPYINRVACEVDQITRMKKDGYTFKCIFDNRRYQCLGLHGTSFTPEMSYERYKGLVEKHRNHGLIPWIIPYYGIFYSRLKRRWDDVDAMALCGLLIGTITDNSVIVAGKDSRKYSKLHGLKGLISNLGAVRDSLYNKDVCGFVSDVFSISGLPYSNQHVMGAVVDIAQQKQDTED